PPQELRGHQPAPPADIRLIRRPAGPDLPTHDGSLDSSEDQNDMNRLLALPDDRLGAPRGDSNPRCLIRRSEFTLAEQRHLGIRGSGYIRSHSSGIARLRVVGQQWDTAVRWPRPIKRARSGAL